MSNKNYGKYFKGESTPETNDRKTPQAPIVTVEPEAEEKVVDVASEPVPVPPAPVYGTVTDCSRLNIRKSPYKQSEPLCVVDRGTQLTIDESQSTVDWYKVYTASGVDGYCMKKFVTLN